MCAGGSSLFVDTTRSVGGSAGGYCFLMIPRDTCCDYLLLVGRLYCGGLNVGGRGRVGGRISSALRNSRRVVVKCIHGQVSRSYASVVSEGGIIRFTGGVNRLGGLEAGTSCRRISVASARDGRTVGLTRSIEGVLGGFECNDI